MSTKEDGFVISGARSHELEMAMNRMGDGRKFTPELFHKLCHNECVLDGLYDVLTGYAAFKQVEHVIDLDAAPFNQWEKEGTVIDEHQKGGLWKFDPAQVEVGFVVAGQKNGIRGHKLRKVLAGKPVFNANLLDFLLAHPELIPEGWKKDESGLARHIFFWGTVYRNRDNCLYVRGLSWNGDAWGLVLFWLDGDWYDFYPAALRAS